MNISKFKLVGKGFSGINLEATEKIEGKQGFIINDVVTRKRPLPVNKETVHEVQKLKYFFLNITRHWVGAFNKYFDMETLEMVDLAGDDITPAYVALKDLWQRVFITGATYKDGGFQITGQIEAFEGGVFGLSTPRITSDDDISFYEECMQQMNHCVESVMEFLTVRQVTANTAKQYSLDLGLDDSLDDNELIEKFIDKIHEKGGIVIMGDDSSSSRSLEEDNSADNDESIVHENQKNIDSANIPVNEDHEEDEDDKSEDIKKYPVTPDESYSGEEQENEKEQEKEEEKEETFPPEEKEEEAESHDAEMDQGPAKPEQERGTLASEGDFPDMDKLDQGPAEDQEKETW